MKWKKPQRVFVCSMGDLFHEDVDFIYIARIFGKMRSAKKHIFLVLTKRPHIMADFISWFQLHWLGSFADAYPKESPNVWLGVTAENQEKADERIPILLDTPAAVRFVSVEPMLSEVNLTRIGGDRFGWGRIDALAGLRFVRAEPLEYGCEWEMEPCAKLNLVICGGETGPGARPIHLDWARSLKDQCQAAGVPFFLKQIHVDGKLIKMPELDGRVWDEYPILD
jgi:protein gp37